MSFSLKGKQYLESLKSSFDRYLEITSWADNSRTVHSILQITHVFNPKIHLEVRTERNTSRNLGSHPGWRVTLAI